MSSHQDPDYYLDEGPDYYYGSGPEPSVPEQSSHPQPYWPATAATDDRTGHPQPEQSMDPVGNSFEIFDTQDVNYFLPTYSPPSTSFQGAGINTDAPYFDDNIPFTSSSSHDFEMDYKRSQNHYGHVSHEQVHDYLDQSFVHGAHQMSGNFAGSSSVYPAQNIFVPPTSQIPSAPAYPCPSSTQFPFSAPGVPMYQTDAGPARPIPDSLMSSVIGTGRTDFPNADVGHSHPPRVVTPPSSQPSAPGPSHPLPSSAEKKRPLPQTADERSETTARRVLPRRDGAPSVHPISSGSHGRSRSNSGVHGRGPLIPQDRYTTSSVSHRRDQRSSITFHLENPDQIGIPVIDLLNHGDSFARIRDSTQAFNHMGKQTFTLRIQWPGYRPWSKTISALDWTSERAPITRVKLAKVVAKAIQDLIDKYNDEPYDPDHAEWHVGPNGIQLDQICLIAVHRVSTGSWQPELCLLEPRR